MSEAEQKETPAPTPEQKEEEPKTTEEAPKDGKSGGGGGGKDKGKEKEATAELQKEVAELEKLLEEKKSKLEASEAVLSKKSKKKGKKDAIETEPVQGTRDFPPEQMRVRSYLFNAFRRSAHLFGFQEYDCPVLESEELYVRKAGEEITDQMYNFVSKDKHRVALRPEMTPSLARLVMAKGAQLLLPAKWFSIPQCWRFETITRGRRREHYQWNMDIIGAKSVSAEVELICAICTTLESFGLTGADVGIKVNSRRALQQVVMNAGVPAEKFAPVCVIVDKLDKLAKEDVEAQLAALDLSPSIVDTITASLSAKSISDLEASLGAEHEAVQELKQFFSLIASYGFGDWVLFDASVVRGLAYYTGIVFECFDRERKFRALCGGGRYDQLLTTFGAKQATPCVGFGFGDCVILELLEDKKLIPPLTHEVDDIVIPFDESMRNAALEVLSKLRRSERVADIILDKKKIGAAFGYADAIGAKRAVLVAPSEFEKGEVQVKMLREGQGKSNNEGGERGNSVKIEDLCK